MAPQKRVAGLDILRALAIFLVIFVHFFLNTEFYTTPLEGNSMIFQTYLRWVVLVSVPVFILLTGYLSGKKDLTKGYYRGILKVIIPYLIYSAAAIVYRIFVLNESKTVLDWIFQVIQFKANGYAWYVEMYVGLFLLIPFLNRLNRALSRNEKKILIGTLLFLTVRFDLLTITPNFWLLLYPLSYYFIGAYIKEYQPELPKGVGWFCFFLISVAYLVSPSITYGGEVFDRMFGRWGSLPIAASSVLFFILIYKSDIRNGFVKKTVSTISLVSFDMYLVSYIVDGVFYPLIMKKYFVNQQQFFPYITVMVPMVFTISFAIALLRVKTASVISGISKS